MCIPLWNCRAFAVSLALLTWGLVLKLDASCAVDLNTVQTMVAAGKIAELKALGRDVLPVMARLYETAALAERTRIAQTFYALGWKSADAKRVLIKDVHTTNQQLRLEVQWALGRVSNDDEVVTVLLNNMQNDANPLFRDKAACALASDQITTSNHAGLRPEQVAGGILRKLKRRENSRPGSLILSAAMPMRIGRTILCGTALNRR